MILDEALFAVYLNCEEYPEYAEYLGCSEADEVFTTDVYNKSIGFSCLFAGFDD
jgi:hypothetical protein